VGRSFSSTWLALKWFGQLAARFATLLFLLSPLAWFHGLVALTYGVEAFFSALVGWHSPLYLWPAAAWLLWYLCNNALAPAAEARRAAQELVTTMA
jgi:hypothetical protein